MQNGLLLLLAGSEWEWETLDYSAGEVDGFECETRMTVTDLTAPPRLSGSMSAVNRLSQTFAVSNDTGAVTVVERLTGDFSSTPDEPYIE